MALDPLTDPTPVPANSWLVITLRPSIAGMLNLLGSVSDAVGSWIDYAPATWKIRSHDVLTSNWFYGDLASVTISVPSATTIGAIGTIADGVSNQLSVSSVVLSGATPPDPSAPPPSPCNGAADFVADPLECTWQALKVPVLIVAALLLIWLAWDSGLLRKAQAAVKGAAKPARKPRGKRVAPAVA